MCFLIRSTYAIFFIGCALLTICIYILIGIPYMLLWFLVVPFVILAFVFNQISHFTLKEIGLLRIAEDTYSTEIKDEEKQYYWHDVTDANLERMSGAIYRLKLNKQRFLLEMEIEELMILEGLLESKDLMKKAGGLFILGKLSAKEAVNLLVDKSAIGITCLHLFIV